MLAHVQAGQVKAKDLDCADQVGQPSTGDAFPAVGAQARLDQPQVGKELLTL
jgi:hypothetical protein